MLELHKQLAAAKTDHAKINLQRQIDATDTQIDQLVYELYELTPDESKIVKESAISSTTKSTKDLREKPLQYSS